MRTKLISYFILLLILLISSCILAPEEELTQSSYDEHNAKSAMSRAYANIIPGTRKHIYVNLDIVYRVFPDFESGNEIMGWVELLDNNPDLATDYWRKCNAENADVIAGMLFYFANQLQPDSVIHYGEYLLSKSDDWFLGQQNYKKYDIPDFYYFSDYNVFDIKVLMAESYYLTGNLPRALELLLEVDDTIELQPTDPYLEILLPQIISDMIEMYILPY